MTLSMPERRDPRGVEAELADYKAEVERLRRESVELHALVARFEATITLSTSCANCQQNRAEALRWKARAESAEKQLGRGPMTLSMLPRQGAG